MDHGATACSSAPAHHRRWLHMPPSASERNLSVVTATHRAYVHAPLRQEFYLLLVFVRN
jgi:hypothetical protein